MSNRVETESEYQSSFIKDIISKPQNVLETKIKNWNPPYCGEIDMRISTDGTWFYCGSPIGRKNLVKLFSSILIKENDKYLNFMPTGMAQKTKAASERIVLRADACKSR